MSQHFRFTRIKRGLGFRTVAAAGMIAGLGAMAGCNIDSHIAPTGPQAVVQFINAAPRYSAVDLNVDSLNLVLGEPYGNGQQIGVPAQATPRHFFVNINNDTTILASTDLLVSDQKVYTVILTQHPVGAGLIVLPDTVTAPSGGQASIRLINASPSAGAVDVYVNTTADTSLASPIATGVLLEGISPYVSVPPGSERVRVTAANTKTVLLDINDVSLALAPGQVRTVLLVDSQGGGLPATWLEIPDLN